MQADETIHLQNAVRNLLIQGRIKYVVYIDDVFVLNQIEVERVLGWYAKALQENQERALELISVPYSAHDEDLWRVMFRSEWDHLSGDEQKIFVERILTILNFEKLKEEAVGGQIRDLFGDSVDYQQMPPSRWMQLKKNLFSQASENERILCLFDQDLSLDETFTASGALSGEGLLKDALDSLDGTCIVCAILSHTIESIEDEKKSHSRFADIYGTDPLAPQRFLPLTKRRLNDPKEFVDGLKKVLLNEICDTLKRSTLKVLQEAYESASKQLLEMDIYAFDRMALQASREAKDDISEVDTILRLFQIYHRQHVLTILSDNEVAKSLSSLAMQARPLSQVSTGVKVDSVYPWVYKLSRDELYESANHIKHRPIETGDIFVFGEKTPQAKEYILLAQPCDLSVRLDGERQQDFVSLIPIIKHQKRYSTKKDRSFWFNFWNTRTILDKYFEIKDDLGVLEFKDAIHIGMVVLDLAVLNSDGSCQIDIQNTSIPPHLTEGIQGRLTKLIRFYGELHARLLSLKGLLDENSQLGPEDRQGLLEGVKRELLLPPAFSQFTSNEPGVYDFQLKRIKRFRQPGADALLRTYTHFLAREVKDFDFSAL